MSNQSPDRALALQLLTFIGDTLRHWKDAPLRPEDLIQKAQSYCFSVEGALRGANGVRFILVGWAERHGSSKAKAAAKKIVMEGPLGENEVHVYRACYEAAVLEQ